MQEQLQAQLEKVSLNQTEQFNQAVQAGVAEAIRTANPVSDPATKKYGAACPHGVHSNRVFELGKTFSNMGHAHIVSKAIATK